MTIIENPTDTAVTEAPSPVSVLVSSAALRDAAGLVRRAGRPTAHYRPPVSIGIGTVTGAVVLQYLDVDVSTSVTVPIVGPRPHDDVYTRVYVDRSAFDAAVKAAPRGKSAETLISVETDGRVTIGATTCAPRIDGADYMGARFDEATAGWAVVSSAEFRRIGAGLAAIASSDDSRPILTGVYFPAGDDGPCAVATDSYRLARLELSDDWADIRPDVDDDHHVILSADVWRRRTPTAAKLWSPHVHVSVDRDNAVKVGTCDHVAHGITWSVTVRGVIGEFPNYRGLLRDDRDHVLDVRCRPDDMACVANAPRSGRPVQLRRDDAATVALTVTGDDEAPAWQTTISATGDGAGSLDPTNRGFLTAFNPQYLADAVKCLQSAYDTPVDLVAYGIDHLKPWVFTDGRPASSADYWHLLMPVRVN